jgi:glycosyltransferase involved in cell wall biosynthesis
MALAITGDAKNIHFAYKNFDDGPPTSLPDGFENLIAIDKDDASTFAPAASYIKKHNIDFAFCFDLPVNSGVVSLLRTGGVRKIVSYWGAPISSENRGLKLLAKRIQVLMNRRKPDHFIFESHAMCHFAVNGRGIPRRMTSVIPTGIDTEKYHPNRASPGHLERLFAIPANANVVFYCGHMERRKGVHVIIDAAMALVDQFDRHDIYFIIAGNRPGEEAVFLNQMGGHEVHSRVHFIGYRKDLHEIMPNCQIGTIASTGWDSFPMSSIEMAACGLPLVVSDLQGLTETIVDEVTGLKFTPGDHLSMARKILSLLDNPQKRESLALAGRARAVSGYSTRVQLERLISCCKDVLN